MKISDMVPTRTSRRREDPYVTSDSGYRLLINPPPSPRNLLLDITFHSGVVLFFFCYFLGLGLGLAHNWAVHMHSPNVVPRTDFEGHTTSGVNNL